MVILVQLRKRHLPQREDQAVNSVLQINRLPRRFAHSGRPQTVEFYSTRKRCRSVIKPKQCGRWKRLLWNSKRWSRGIAASGKPVWNHHETLNFILIWESTWRHNASRHALKHFLKSSVYFFTNWQQRGRLSHVKNRIRSDITFILKV